MTRYNFLRKTVSNNAVKKLSSSTVYAYVCKYFIPSRISHFMLQRRVKIDLSYKKTFIIGMKKLKTGMKDIKICNTDQSNIVDTVKDSCQIVLGHAKISRLGNTETKTLYRSGLPVSGIFNRGALK